MALHYEDIFFVSFSVLQRSHSSNIQVAVAAKINSWETQHKCTGICLLTCLFLTASFYKVCSAGWKFNQKLFSLCPPLLGKRVNLPITGTMVLPQQDTDTEDNQGQGLATPLVLSHERLPERLSLLSSEAPECQSPSTRRYLGTGCRLGTISAADTVVCYRSARSNISFL